jgi:hypothetical protein
MARINEIGDTEKGQYMLGRLRARKFKREGFQKGNEIGKYAEKAREKATQKNKKVDGVDHIVYSPDKYNRLTNSHANGWHDEMRKDENRNMKQQLKLNESELHNLIEGAVKQLVMEYLPYEGGKVAARRLQQGDTSAFEKYMDYGINNGWTNDDMTDFQTGIETGPSVVEDEDFEDLKTKDNKPSAMKVVACRFKKKRPLIFLGYETDNKTWFVLDEKRFPVLEDPNSPFLGVNI